MYPLDLHRAQTRVVLTLRTGHQVAGPWQRVRHVYRRHIELADGSTWPLPNYGDSGVYPADGPVHLEIAP
jgi:hypothetical protein